jgi:hypothetical protein
MENKENKVANSFLADRMAGLVDELGNPIPQQKRENSAIVEEPIIQTEVANSFLANRMAGLVDELGNPIPQQSKENNAELVEEPTPFVVEENQTEVQNTVVEQIEEPTAETKVEEPTTETKVEENNENKKPKKAKKGKK